MKLGISHLAFRDNIRIGKTFETLQKLGIDNLEIVFSKFEHGKDFLSIPTYSTQSILYDSNVVDLLDENLLKYMETFTDKCCNAGVELLVLGSPSQRNVFDLDKLIHQFSLLDQILRSKNLMLCIEPNAKKYKGKYFYTVDEIVDFLNIGNFTNISTMIDTHNLIEEHVNILDTLDKHLTKISHIHISEKDLGPLIESRHHLELSYELRKLNYNKMVTYEALHLQNIVESTKKFTDIYGNS
jgi:sugar phosphate isomerase/epimerase